MMFSIGSVLDSGECGSGAMPRAPPAVPQPGIFFALALTTTAGEAVAEKGMPAGMGPAAPSNLSDSV